MYNRVDNHKTQNNQQNVWYTRLLRLLAVSVVGILFLHKIQDHDIGDCNRLSKISTQN